MRLVGMQANSSCPDESSHGGGLFDLQVCRGIALAYTVSVSRRIRDSSMRSLARGERLGKTGVVWGLARTDFDQRYLKDMRSSPRLHSTMRVS